MGRVHCRRNAVTMTIAARWLKEDGDMAVSQPSWDEREQLARFLGLVPKREFVWGVLDCVRSVEDFLDLDET